MPGPRRKDLTGQKFNMLTAVRFTKASPGGQAYWLFRCECGTEKEVRANHAKTGQIKSCGCSSSALMSKNGSKHGHYKGDVATPEYAAWSLMKARCNVPSNHAYAGYGGRGITVCDRWNSPDGFVAFYEDMGPRPEGGTLDRIDNGKGYSPDNCRWVSMKVQGRNRRNNRIIEYRGRSMCISEAADLSPVTLDVIWKRIAYGWDVDRAVETPSSKGGRRK